MTITNTTLRNDYVANGSSTVFSFAFIVLSETAGYTIQVITTDLVGVETIKTQGVDYTVQLNDNGLGTITFATAPLLNHKITLLSNVPNTQETDYIKAGTDKFPAESHEKALDKLTLICKQFAEKFNRIVSLPKSSTLQNIEFPINASNANQVLVINNDGTNLTTANLADKGIIPVSTFITSLLDDINSSQARATLEAQQLNANLSALANLTGASNKLPYFTGAGAMALKDLMATNTNQGLTYINQPITIANNATDANNDIDFTAGNFQFSDKSGEALASAMTKRLDANWTAGNDNGGLDTGTKANSTWYHCYAIYNPTTQASDFLFSASATNPTLPSGFTKFSRRGSIKTDGSGNIIAFTQTGNYFEWKTPIKDYDEATYTTATSKTISTPPNTIAKMMQFFDSNASGPNVYGYISNLSSNDIAPSSSAFTIGALLVSGVTEWQGCCPVNVQTNSLSQVRIRFSTSNGSYIIITLGWTDNLN